MPSMMRNSPTKPFSSGNPTDDSEAMTKQRRKPRHRARESAEISDHARMASLINHPDDEKERARRNAVIEHLIKRALHPLFGEREQSEHDESHVTDRRIGHEPLHVGLHHRDERAVDDADDGEHDEDGRKVARGFGEEARS